MHDPRRLATETRREKFQRFSEIVRKSKNPWSSLHIVPKQTGNWCPCGYYRRLNDITIQDRYPLLRLHDFLTNC